MSSIGFWKPVCQLFNPEEPLATPEALSSFYVPRNNSPVERLTTKLSLADKPDKFLLSGHKGSGKTTELRRLQQKLAHNYTVIWIDAEFALNKFNAGHAEVVILIGLEIYNQAKQAGWKLNSKLFKSLEESLKTVVTVETKTESDGLKLPEVLEKLGMTLKRGLDKQVTKTKNVRPVLDEIIKNVNAIIHAAEKERLQKLLVIVDGLDKHIQDDALNMFSSPLLTEPDCHIIYSVPISIRYSIDFRQPMQNFRDCLDLNNPSVFECDENFCPTKIPCRSGRDTLLSIVNKRLACLPSSYKNQNIFEADALELLCEKSGGVTRDLVRLVRASCEEASINNLTCVDLNTAKAAVKEERRSYNLASYHYPELHTVHCTGSLTTETHKHPQKGEFVICDELLHNKFVLGYYHEGGNDWFDVNPILIEDLERWQKTNASKAVN